MSDIFPPAEHIPARPCRIDIVEYRKKSYGYSVFFNGDKVGYVFRHMRFWVFSEYHAGPVLSASPEICHRTRGEAAGALIRSVYPDWKGCAP